MKRNPLYSIVIPHFEQMPYIFGALDSVFSQTYDNIELIVIDDASGTYDEPLIRQYVEKHAGPNIVRFELLHNEVNLGTCRSLNRACAAAGGKYMQIFAADDELTNSQVVENFVSYLEKTPEASFVSAMALMYDNNMEAFIEFFSSASSQINLMRMTAAQQYALLTKACVVAMGSSCFTAELYKTQGPFNEANRLIEDWTFFLKITRSGVKIHTTLFPALKHRDGGVSHDLSGGEISATRLQYCIDVLQTRETEILPFLKSLPMPLQLHAYREYLLDVKNLAAAGGRYAPVSRWRILKSNTALARRLTMDALVVFARKKSQIQNAAVRSFFLFVLSLVALNYLTVPFLSAAFSVLSVLFLVLSAIFAALYLSCLFIDIMRFLKRQLAALKNARR